MRRKRFLAQGVIHGDCGLPTKSAAWALGIGLVLQLCGACVWGAENSGGWRGPQHNGVFPAQGLLKQWPEAGPKLLWEAQVGGGWSGACVAEGLVYFCGRKETNGAVRAFDLDGRLVWETTYDHKHAPNGPQATPVVANGLFFDGSVHPFLYALDAKTGKTIWSFDITTLGADWLAGSPTVVGDLVVVAMKSPGDGVPSFAAFQCATGKLVWKGDLAPSPRKGKGWSAFHGTPSLVRLGDRDAIFCSFYCGVGAVWADTGEKCWTDSTVGVKNRVQAQLVANEGYLFLHGTVMARIAPDGAIRTLWEGKVKIAEYNVSYAHTIIKDGRLFTFTQDKSVNPSVPGKVRMLDAETGEERGSLACAGKGALAWADDMLYLQDNRPGMVLIEATKDGLREVSSFRLPFPHHASGDGIQLFTPPILAEGRLFLRDQSRVLVYDLRAPASSLGEAAR